MSSYAFWNNKGGVGKSFLCFVTACEYANRFPAADVYVIDLCPQANVSETLLGGQVTSPKPMNRLLGESPRRSVAGYLEARISSPFKMFDDITSFVSTPARFNSYIPKNVFLICGDNLLEILAEPVRQSSQLSLPTDAWAKVTTWIRDLRFSLASLSGPRDSIFVIDCNPSFAVYTQLALVAADHVIVPFTADDSSRRGIENVVALLYGFGTGHVADYARLSFSKRASEEGVQIPKLHTFVSNRQTYYDAKPSKGFEAMSKAIKRTVDEIHKDHRTVFAYPQDKPSNTFINVPDYHTASIVCASQGMPVHRLKAGPHEVAGERIQINPEPLRRYKNALKELVNRF